MSEFIESFYNVVNPQKKVHISIIKNILKIFKINVNKKVKTLFGRRKNTNR